MNRKVEGKTGLLVAAAAFTVVALFEAGAVWAQQGPKITNSPERNANLILIQGSGSGGAGGVKADGALAVDSIQICSDASKLGDITNSAKTNKAQLIVTTASKVAVSAVQIGC